MANDLHKGAGGQKNALHNEGIGSSWILTGIAHFFGNEGVTQATDAIEQARAAGVPWLTIFKTILPILLSLFSGGTVNLAAIIAAILALIKPAPPAPTVT